MNLQVGLTGRSEKFWPSRTLSLMKTATVVFVQKKENHSSGAWLNRHPGR
jgi:hypothetical protein